MRTFRHGAGHWQRFYGADADAFDAGARASRRKLRRRYEPNAGIPTAVRFRRVRARLHAFWPDQVSDFVVRANRARRRRFTQVGSFNAVYACKPRHVQANREKFWNEVDGPGAPPYQRALRVRRFTVPASAWVATAWSSFNGLDCWPSPKPRNLLTNSNLTLNSEPAVAVAVRGTAPYYSGKFYFEVQFPMASPFSKMGFGVVAAGLQIGVGPWPNNNPALSPLPNGAWGAVLFASGSVFVNAASAATVPACTPGVYAACAVDFGAGLVWFRSSPTGQWNGSSSANPATGVGGLTLPQAGVGPADNATSFCAYAQISAGAAYGTQQVTANLGAAPFAGSVPAGFVAGWPVAATAATAFVTQTVAEILTPPGPTQARVTQTVVEFLVPVVTTVDPTVTTLTGLSTVFDDATPTPFVRLLPTSLADRDFAVDYTDAYTNVHLVSVKSLRRQLLRSREPYDRTVALTLLRTLGVQIDSSALADQDVDRLIRFAAMFRGDNGSNAFVDFVAFVKNIRLTANVLWADSSGWVGGTDAAYQMDLFLSPQGAPVSAGGTWVPTSTFDVAYDVLAFGLQDDSQLRALLEFFMPVTKVLRNIVPTVYVPPATLYMGAVQQVKYKVSTYATATLTPHLIGFTDVAFTDALYTGGTESLGDLGNPVAASFACGDLGHPVYQTMQLADFG